MGLIRNIKDKAEQVRVLEDQLRARGGLAKLSGDAAALNATGAERRRLWAEGVSGRATIRAARDTGERLAGNAVLDLDLVVTLDQGEPYETTLRMPIAGGDLSPYTPGTQYRVRVDPADYHKLAFSA